MSSFFDRVVEVLRQDARFFTAGGELLRNAVYEAAMQMDAGLIKALYADPATRARFFADADGIAVFDKVGFGWVINNREFLPDSYTRYRNRIGLADENGDLIGSSGSVELVFPYKDCVLEGGQTKEDQKRSEIFYHEALAPDEIDRLLYRKVFTHARRYEQDGARDADSFCKGDNLIIRGNNLLALASIVPVYEGQIQLIYIDPPYNTANDSFRYNDSFKRSTWLCFMKNRLEIALRLLKDSGVIAISINYKELSYLKVLCDEIIGEENYISTVTVKTATTASFRAINDCPVNVSEFILLYAKRKPAAKIKPVYVASEYSEDYGSYIENFEQPCENWRIVSVDSIIYAREGVRNWQEYREKYGERWKEVRYKAKERFCMEHSERIVSLNTMQKPSKEIRQVIEQSKQNRDIVFPMGKNYVYNGRSLAFFSKKLREIDGKLAPTEILTNLWTDISFLSLGNEGGVDLPNGKKPEKLVKRLLDLFADQGDIVLDYHLGTGTTCAVAHKMGIQYIGIEQLDYGEDDSTVRLLNVIRGEQGGVSPAVGWKGGGAFTYCELAQSNCRFADRIQSASDTAALLKLWEEMKVTGFISYRVNPKDVDDAVEEFAGLSVDDQKRLLMELLDKNQLYINYCDLEDETFGVSQRDKAFTRSFYGEV